MKDIKMAYESDNGMHSFLVFETVDDELYIDHFVLERFKVIYKAVDGRTKNFKKVEQDDTIECDLETFWKENGYNWVNPNSIY